MATKTKTDEKLVHQQTEQKSTARFDSIYMICAIAAIVVFLVIALTTYFRSSFVMYEPEKVAAQYMKNVSVNDGYNAMKYTITIKNSKLGDFIIDNYMKKYINEDKKVKAPELSAEEEGQKLSQTLETMYPVFTDLVETYGFENYDKLFTEYFAKYNQVHHDIYGHDIITTDDMFDAFEGNVKTYSNEYVYLCEMNYGKGEQYAEKYLGSGKANLADDDLYSAGFSISINTEVLKEFSEQEVEEYCNAINNSAEKLSYYEKYNISLDEISEISVIKTTEVISGEGNAELIEAKNAELKENSRELTLVKIGSQWYVGITA